jgi:hypothetical protein
VLSTYSAVIFLWSRVVTNIVLYLKSTFKTETYWKSIQYCNVLIVWLHRTEALLRNCSAGQENSCLLQNQKVHYSVHKSLSVDPIPSQMNSVHAFQHHLGHTLILYFHSLFPSGFPSKILYYFLIYSCVLHVLSWFDKINTEHISK